MRLERSQEHATLNIANRTIDAIKRAHSSPERALSVDVEVNIFTDNQHALNEVLEIYGSRVRVHSVSTNAPQKLPIIARDWLIHNARESDIYIYSEDDLIVNDPLFLDKQIWFLDKTQSKCILMPHRFEVCNRRGYTRLFVDGALSPDFIGKFYKPQDKVASGVFEIGSEAISFDLAKNPHSGCFILDDNQRRLLRTKYLPEDGFVSPLETAATLTVMGSFSVFKTSADSQDFMVLEHGHPSFLGYLDQFEHRRGGH